jgi:hypothetical protein
MTKTKCPNCGEQYTNFIRNCPFCTTQNKYPLKNNELPQGGRSKKVQWVSRGIIIIVVLLFIRGCYDVKKEDNRVILASIPNSDVQFISPNPYVDSALYYDSLKKVDPNTIKESIKDENFPIWEIRRAQSEESKKVISESHFPTQTTPGSSIKANMEYATPWKTSYGSISIAISKALIKHNIMGCGEYYVRPSKNTHNSKHLIGEYLVACSSDGLYWQYYVVFLPKGDVFSYDMN